MIAYVVHANVALAAGELGLGDPGERRYFLVLKDDQVEAFVVCTPIYARNGICFDLMRRKEKTLRGTSQLLTASDASIDMSPSTSSRSDSDPLIGKVVTWRSGCTG